MNGLFLRTVVAGSAALIAAILAAGCIPIFWAYPTVSYVPGLELRDAAPEVFTVRVDIEDYRPNTIMLGGPSDRYVLRPVTIAPSGRVGSQAKLSLDHFNGKLVYGILPLVRHKSHTVCVRLYRPGYDLVEVRSLEWVGPICWRAASDLASRERAVDDLLATHATRGSDQCGSPEEQLILGLVSGRAVPEHQQVLLFAATEYEKLADFEAGDNQGLVAFQGRLRDKAARLRGLGDR